jgi:hypothetical protein
MRFRSSFSFPGSPGLAALFSLLLLTTLCGCGGTGGSSATTLRGKFQVQWPELVTRQVEVSSGTAIAPRDARSVRITLRLAVDPGGGLIGDAPRVDSESIVNRDPTRPGGYTGVYITPTEILSGRHKMVADFFSGANGGGKLLATANGTVDVDPNSGDPNKPNKPNVLFTLRIAESVNRITSVVVPNQEVRVGETKALQINVTFEGDATPVSAITAFAPGTLQIEVAEDGTSFLEAHPNGVVEGLDTRRETRPGSSQPVPVATPVQVRVIVRDKTPASNDAGAPPYLPEVSTQAQITVVPTNIAITIQPRDSPDPFNPGQTRDFVTIRPEASLQFTALIGKADPANPVDPTALGTGVAWSVVEVNGQPAATGLTQALLNATTDAPTTNPITFAIPQDLRAQFPENTQIRIRAQSLVDKTAQDTALIVVRQVNVTIVSRDPNTTPGQPLDRVDLPASYDTYSRPFPFGAVVENAQNPGVIWAVRDATGANAVSTEFGGTITADGLYTPPRLTGADKIRTLTVVATSVETGRSDSVPVSVRAGDGSVIIQ